MLRAEEIRQQLFDYSASNEIKNLKFLANDNARYYLPKINDQELEDLLTFIVISIFNCIQLSIVQNKNWKKDNEISALHDKITKFLQSNEINFVTLKFFQKRLSLLTFKKVSKACQKIKVHSPPNHVNDKNKSVLFNNEKVTYPWVIKFSEIKNCFSQQGFEAIMKKLGIGIDINLDNKVLIVKIIGIGNKH